MKTVNKRTRRILDILTNGLTTENGYKKIDNSGGLYLPVHVSVVNDTLFAVAHYFEKNGDLMADPEMMFSKQPGANYIPVYYKLDSLGILNTSVIFKGEKITGYRPNMFNDQIYFASQWMRNIAYQQEL